MHIYLSSHESQEQVHLSENLNISNKFEYLCLAQFLVTNFNPNMRPHKANFKFQAYQVFFTRTLMANSYVATRPQHGSC